MIGTSMNVRPMSPVRTKSLAATRSTASAPASRTLRGPHATVPGALQLSTSGVASRIPEVSPCHQVHQFWNSASGANWWVAASVAMARLGATVEHSAATATNLTTCSAVSKRRGTPISRRTSAAAASVCRVLPVATSSAIGHDASTARLAAKEPAQTPGQARQPSSRSPASAIPEAGQMAAA
jgi:hypothetical protein